MKPVGNKKPKRKNRSPFNTILFIALMVIVIYLLVQGYIWAWNTMAAW